MKQKLVLSIMAVLLVVGCLAGSLMTLAPLQEVEAGVWHGTNCQTKADGSMNCDSVEWHGYGNHDH